MTSNVPLSDSTTDAELEIAEFRELRATIRERGTARAFVSALTFVSWGALGLAAFRGGHPIAALVPLVVLGAGFEIVFALHVGAERIGRYLSVRYESNGATPKWEAAVAEFGRRPAAARPRTESLLQTAFVAAVLVNLMIGLGIWWLPLGVTSLLGRSAMLLVAAHLIVLLRIAQAVSQAAGQRARDAATFADIEYSRGRSETKSN